MKCPNCGKEIPFDAAFCSYCGKSVEKAPKEPVKELVRPRSGRLLTGVAAGMSRYFGLPVIAIRIGFIFMSILTVGLVAVMYLVFAYFIPQEQE